MGQWCIEIGSLFAHLTFGFLVGSVANLSHEVHAVGNHDEDDAHVLGKRQQEVAEILAFDDGVLLVEFLYAP